MSDFGEILRYVGCSEVQATWAGCDDPRGKLEPGRLYTLNRRDVRTWHTKLYLAEYPTLGFNSVCFEGE